MGRESRYGYCHVNVTYSHDNLPTEKSPPVRGHRRSGDLPGVPVSSLLDTERAALHKSLSGSVSR